MASAGRPLVTVAIAIRWLAASHAPAEWMNWMLDVCGSFAVLVSLCRTRPVAASATNRSIDRRPRSDRKAIHLPSGLSDGPEVDRAPPSPFRRRAVRSRSAASVDASERLVGLADCRLPVRRELLWRRCRGPARWRSLELPVDAPTRQHLRDDPIAPAAGDVSPEGVTPAVREVLRIVEIVDRRQLVPAARRREATSRCSRRPGPIETVLRHALDEPERQAFDAAASRAAARDRSPMSYWKACTSSWPMTWSVSASGPASGSTIRRRSDSVTPPVPSPSSPSMVLVCSKSGWEAYKTSGCRPRSDARGPARAWCASARPCARRCRCPRARSDRSRCRSAPFSGSENRTSCTGPCFDRSTGPMPATVSAHSIRPEYQGLRQTAGGEAPARYR